MKKLLFNNNFKFMKKIFRNAFASVAFLLGASLFTTGCTKTEVVKYELSEVPGYVKIPYSVSVSGDLETRATIGHEFSRTLLFDDGDVINVEGIIREDNVITARCFGTLKLVAGDGEEEGTFIGDIHVPQGMELESFKNVKYTLVGKNDKMSIWENDAHTILSAARNTPIITKTFTEAVEKYSNIGYLSEEGFTEDIDLDQFNAFFEFRYNLPMANIYIDEVKAVKVTFTDPSEDKMVVSTDPSFSCPIEMGDFYFVVPYAKDNEVPAFTNIKVEITIQNGRVLVADYPTENQVEGVLVKSGMIFLFEEDFEAPALTKDSQVGDIGVINGITGIVVDLGDYYGKEAIAVYNLGAEGKEMELGDYLTFAQALKRIPEGWHMPVSAEFDNLINNYEYSLMRSGEGAERTDWCIFKITEQRELTFRCDKYGEGVENPCYYWTNSAWRSDMFSRRMLYFKNNKNNEGEFQASTEWYYDCDKPLYVRPMYKLK